MKWALVIHIILVVDLIKLNVRIWECVFEIFMILKLHNLYDCSFFPSILSLMMNYTSKFLFEYERWDPISVGESIPYKGVETSP